MRLLSRPASQFSQTQITRTLSTVAVALMGVVLLSNPPLVAQFTTASLGGTVIDPSGAAVPNAKVGVRNKDTAFTRSVESAGTSANRGFRLIKMVSGKAAPIVQYL